MRYLEVRRHAARDKPNPHINQAGVALARRTGENMGPFARVLSSPAVRCVETALAMGFALTDEATDLRPYGEDVEREVMGETSFVDWSRAFKRGGAAARFAKHQARYWGQIAGALPDGGAALAITHGGVIELGAVGCLPDADHAAWGEALWVCEGVRVTFEGEAPARVEILRVKRE